MQLEWKIFSACATNNVRKTIYRQSERKTALLKLFDSHCHLDDRCYRQDRPAVLARAAEAGVAGVMIVGVTPESSQAAAEIARQHPGAYASVGIHPHDAAQASEEALDRLRKIAAAHDRVRAWGETGLDFNRMYSPQKDQETWFARQIAAAADMNLPLIFHERDSGGRFLDMLRTCLRSGQRGVVHCFSGSETELRAYLDLGLYIGITGVITIKQRGAALREMVPLIPDDRLLIETDAPYLTPAPEKNRFKRNEPALVKSVFSKLAEVKQRPPEQLAPILWDNTCRLFGLSTELGTNPKQ